MANLPTSLSSFSAATGLLVEVDDGGLWINGQQAKGPAGKGLRKGVDVARLDRALAAVVVAGVPARGDNESPLAPLWKAVQAAYAAA